LSDNVKQRFFIEAANTKLTGKLKKDGLDVSEATFNQKPMTLPPVKEDKMYAFIGNGTFDELYMGIDNPMDFAFSAPAGYTEQISLSAGEVVKHNDKSFLRFKSEGFTTVSVYAVNGNDKKLLQEREFKVIMIPNPDVYLSGYKGGVISKDIVKVAKKIELKTDAAHVPSDVYNCESFDITVVPFDNPIGEIKMKGNSGTGFSAESREILKNVKRGDVIVLDNFKVQTVDGIERRIPAVVYRII